MSIELVAFDLDGTILENGDTIADECLAAIRAVRDAGVRCVINSGRSTDFQAELLVRHDVLLCFDALIGDERWVQLVDHESGRGGRPELRPLEPWNSDVQRRWTALEPMAEQWCRRLEDQSAGRGWSCRPSDPRAGRARGMWWLTFQSAEQALELLDWLEPRLAGGPLAANCNGTIVHIYDRACDKGTTLLALSRHFGVAAQDVLAFGDNFNDKPMLDGRYGFAAATVANADPAVQEWVRCTGGPVAGRACGAGVADVLTDVAAPRSIRDRPAGVGIRPRPGS
ncbi:HAD family phosphatase [Microlunatus elymi]|uniref:HAD family phosphatase n=1 Tax=Microlunatus elymi TaxID=2596828 RepID=A0A516PWR0_9ACTN|nr:HAD family hydrolase [Microlunatus elymi]QDP95627.1 HAD family phosphatase [Microlunatus elymi]